MQTDAVIIGAGVVGLAIAERLSRTRRVVVLEKERLVGTGVTSRNSQVLHAGMYYPSGTWKARLCVAGHRSLSAWCTAHGVPLQKPGKLIVATSADEEPALDALLKQGRANGVDALEPVGASFVRAKEPSVRATAALWSPNTGILDVHALVKSLETEARAHGATLALAHRVEHLEPRPRGALVHVIDPQGERVTLDADLVVNAAGLDADRVAEHMGLDVDALGYRQHFVKGHYFRLRRRGALSHLVYPVPAKHLAGLGVHVTLGLDGDVRLGPDVLGLDARVEDYSVDESLRAAFHAGASRYLPDLRLDELEPDTAGIRPKLSRVGEPFRDFVISEESARGWPGVINLLGIESPGLTCSLELAAEVERLALR